MKKQLFYLLLAAGVLSACTLRLLNWVKILLRMLLVP